MAYKVGEVARLARVSVRTLHHYDAIGLLTPSGRTEAGYRLYVDDDLERLQSVLLYRELGFKLEAIRDLMADPRFDRRAALAEQREQLARRLRRSGDMLGLIDKTLAALEEGIPMTQDEMFEALGEFDPSEHEDEAKKRWGDGEAVPEVGAPDPAVLEGGLGALQGGERRRQQRHRGAHGRRRRARRPEGRRRGGAPAPADRHVVLPVLSLDARAARTIVRRRPAVHGHVREDPPGDGAIPERRHRRHRDPG